jgi:hypothetical protein
MIRINNIHYKILLILSFIIGMNSVLQAQDDSLISTVESTTAQAQQVEDILKQPLHYQTNCRKNIHDPAHFGSEFTFTNEEIMADGKRLGDEQSASPSNLAAMETWKNWVQKECPNCVITKQIDREKNPFYRIEHPTGFWFQIAVDPWVVETQMKPLTLQEYKKLRNVINSLVFEGAKKSAGLTPHRIIGGGHIHLDLETTFKNDARFFRNLFADYQNFPELAVGVFGDHSDNAPPLAVQKKSQREELHRILTNFDTNPFDYSIEELAEEIEKNVYTETFYYKFGPKKYQAVNLNRVTNPHIPSSDRTIEIRGFAPQKSIDEFILILELLEARLAYVKSYDGSIKFNHETTLEADPVEETISDPQRVVDQFYKYVTQAGLSWEKYKVLLPEPLQQIQAKHD